MSLSGLDHAFYILRDAFSISCNVINLCQWFRSFGNDEPRVESDPKVGQCWKALPCPWRNRFDVSLRNQSSHLQSKTTRKAKSERDDPIATLPVSRLQSQSLLANNHTEAPISFVRLAVNLEFLVLLSWFSQNAKARVSTSVSLELQPQLYATTNMENPWGSATCHFLTALMVPCCDSCSLSWFLSCCLACSRSDAKVLRSRLLSGSVAVPESTPMLVRAGVLIPTKIRKSLQHCIVLA